MTIPRPNLVAAEDSIELTIAQGIPEAEPESPAPEPPQPEPEPPPAKPKPPEAAPPPTEVKAPGIDEAEAQLARARQTYASRLLQEIRRHRPSVTAIGSVVVSFSVGGNGEMGAVAIVRSSGKDELDSAALRMVRAARPEPPPDGHFAGSTTINFVDR